MAHIFTILNLMFLSVLLVSCSSNLKRNVSVPDGEPEWLYSVTASCSDNEICASGEGSNLAEADAHAKKALAGIFQTKIKSEFQFSKHSFSDNEEIEMKESIEEDVNQQVDLLLKGAFIKKRFKKDGLMFALAALDKNKSLKVLRQELSKIDDEMEHYFNQKSRLYLRKLNLLFNKREVLNEKLTLVDRAGVPRRISFSQVNELKFTSKGGSKLSIVSSNDVPSVLLKKLEESFTEVGYKITKKNNSEFFINIKFDEKEEYLNVKGFKKFTFQVDVNAKNNLGKQVGGYSISKVSNGRDKKDAFLKVRSNIVLEIQTNIEKLNLN